MTAFNVEYEYDVTHFGELMVDAEDSDQAYDIALDKLSDILDPNIQELAVTSIKEVVKNV